jgi:hypothetical protein
MSNLPKGNDMTTTQPPTEDTTAASRTEKLDEIGNEHGVPRDGADDATYADVIMDALDTKVQALWDTQDVICTLLINSESAS